MLPVIIQDYITKLLDKKTHVERRQFYYSTLVTIKTSIDKALKDYDTERKFKK
jgi:hypothetical protein